MAVPQKDAGGNWRSCPLATQLASPGHFLVEGLLSSTYKLGSKEYTTNAESESRHAIAVVNGEVLEKEFKMPAAHQDGVRLGEFAQQATLLCG